MKLLLTSVLLFFALALKAQEPLSSAYFDSVAAKHHVSSCKIEKQKVEEITYNTPLTYYNPRKFLNPKDSSMDDTFTTQAVNATYILIRIKGKVFQSISTDEIADQFPQSLLKIKKAFPLPDGSIGLLIYDAQMGHSGGVCGSASRVSITIVSINKNNQSNILGILYSSCNKDRMNISGIKKDAPFYDDSTITFTPTKFAWEKKKLVMSCDENFITKSGTKPPYAGKKRSFEFIGEKNPLLVKMSEEY